MGNQTALRLLGVLLFFLSMSFAQAKEYCSGGVTVRLQHADGTSELLNEGFMQSIWFDTSLTLAPGEYLRLTRWRTGGFNCTGAGGLSVKYAPVGDTADWFSQEICPYQLHSTTVEIDQPGSYYVDNHDVDWGLGALIFIDAPVHPFPIGLAFTMAYPNNAVETVPPGDTCLAPCVNAYLGAGQSVHMWAVSGGVVPFGGHAVVRFAPEGDTVTFDSTPTIVPLEENGSYAFSADGSYLLSVEDSSFATPAYAFVKVSHLPFPRVDMSLTIERANGTEEEFDYMQPNSSNNGEHSIELGIGDTLRIDHHAITEPCNSVRMQVHRSASWAPAWYNDSLVVDTPSTALGVRLSAPGSYFLTHVSECGVLTCSRQLFINAPEPQLDIVVSIRHGDGSEDELFRTHALVDPPPHLDAHLGQGDSVRVRVELINGWCSRPLFELRESGDSSEASTSDPLSFYNGYGAFSDLTFRNAGRHLIHFDQDNQYTCFEDQDVFLDVILHSTEIDLLVDQVQMDGTTVELTHAEAGEAATYAEVELATGDSLLASTIGQFEPCTGLVLKGYRSTNDAVTISDPVFMYIPVDSTGKKFRETGLLLITVEDTCGALCGSAILNVSEAMSSGISAGAATSSTFHYDKGILWIRTALGARLQLRNAMGQLVREAHLNSSSTVVPVPFNDVAPGMYIATLLSPTAINSYRFVVN